MDVGDAIGLDDQRNARVLRILEPGEGAIVGIFGEQILRALAHDTERFGRLALFRADHMAELSEHALVEPAQHFRALFALLPERFDRVRIGQHRALQFGPVLNRRAHIAQRFLKARQQFAALTGIDARSFDVDHRFIKGVVGIAIEDSLEAAVAAPHDRHHRMDQPVDRQTARGDGGGGGVDQEWHIVIDDGDAHEAPLFAEGLQRDGGAVHVPRRSGFEDEPRGFVQAVLVHRIVAREQRVAHAFGETFDQLGIDGGRLPVGLFRGGLLGTHRTSRRARRKGRPGLS